MEAKEARNIATEKIEERRSHEDQEAQQRHEERSRILLEHIEQIRQEAYKKIEAAAREEKFSTALVFFDPVNADDEADDPADHYSESAIIEDARNLAAIQLEGEGYSIGYSGRSLYEDDDFSKEQIGWETKWEVSWAQPKETKPEKLGWFSKHLLNR